MAKLKLWEPDPYLPEVGYATFDDEDQRYPFSKSALEAAGFEVPKIESPGPRLAEASPGTQDTRSDAGSQYDPSEGMSFQDINQPFTRVAPAERVDPSKMNVPETFTSRQVAPPRQDPKDVADLPLLPKQRPAQPETDPEAEAMIARAKAAGIPRRGAAPRMVPTTASTTVESGPAYDPEMASDRIKAARAVTSAQVSGLAERAAQERANAATLAERAAETEENLQERQREKDAVMGRYREKRAALDEDLALFEKNERPDPGKVWDGNEFALVGAIIGQVLNVMGGGNPTTIMSAVERHVQRNLDLQDAQYRNGIRGRENAIARTMDDFDLDYSEAKSAVELQSRQLVDWQMKRYAAEVGSQEAMQKAQELIALNEQKLLESEQKFMREAQGTSKTTYNERYVQPGGSGGIEAEIKRLKQELERKELHAKLRGEIVDTDVDATKLKYATARADLEKGIKSLRAFRQRMDTQKEQFGGIPGLGVTTLGEGPIQSLTRGGQFVASEMLGSEYADTAIKNRSDMEQALIDAQSAIKGIPSDKDAARLDKAVMGARRGEDVYRRVRQMEELMENSLQTLDAVSPGAARELERNKEKVRGLSESRAVPR